MMKRLKLRTWIALGLVVVLLPIILFNAFRPSPTSATWYNDAWIYRQKITIGNSGSATTDQKVKFDVDTDALTTDKLQSDCDDIRFTDMNGKLLRHYLDTSGGACDTNSTDFYVLLPTINAGETVLYMYYGNPSASGISEGTQFSQSTFSPTSGPTAASEEKGPAPVGYWSFDEGYGNATYNRDNTNNGTISGALWKSEDNCVSGKCLYFDGNDDNVDMGDPASGIFDPGTADFSYSIWAKVLPSGTFSGLVVKGHPSAGPSNPGYQLLWRDDDADEFQVRIQDVSSNASTLNYTDLSLVTDKKWHQFTVVKTATTITLYVDGLQAATQSHSVSGSIATTDTLTFGSYGGSTGPFEGFLDEPKYYNYALSAAQIKGDFAAKGGSEGNSTTLGATKQRTLNDGLVTYLKMDETAANSCTGGTNDSCDSSGNALDGAWSGDTTASIGKFGNGTTYDGTGDYTSVASIPAMSKVSAFAWYKMSGSASGNNTIFRMSNDDIGVRVAVNGATRFHIDQFDSLAASPTITSAYDTSWHQIGLTYDGSKLNAYFDGELVSSTTSSTTYSVATGTLRIGARDDALGEYFNGLIDGVRVYSRALSSDEVKGLYNWAPGPTAYWNFDERTSTSANDISTNGNTGTLSCAGVGCSNPAWTSGKYGSGLKFTRVSASIGSIVTAADASSLEPLTQLSLSTWVKRDTTGARQMILAKSVGSGHADSQYWLEIDGSDQLAFYVSINSDGTTLTATDLTITDTTNWHHIEATWNGSTMRLYLDGKASSLTGTIAGTMNDTNHTVDIGRISITNGFHFDGILDEVKIYNYARNSAQVVEDMNGGHPLGGSPVSSQVAYWALDEQYGTTVNNTAPSTFTTSISGAAWKTKEDCKINGCLDFDGTDDVLTVTNSSAIDLNDNLASGFTVGAWVYVDSDGENDTGQIFQKGTNTYCRSDTESASRVDIECSLDLATTDATLNISSAVAVGAWNYIAVGYTDDSDDEITIWINGVKRGTSTNGVGSLAAESSNLLIGGTTTANFDGRIDEFKIYSSELTSEQMQLDANANAAINFGVGTNEATQLTDGAGNPPVGYWNLDERTGTITNDQSGNSNTGTLTSTSWGTGKYGSALAFDGSSSKDTISDSSSLSLTTSGTIEAWVNSNRSQASDDGTTVYRSIVNKWDNGSCQDTGQGYFLDWRGTSSSSDFRGGLCNGTSSQITVYNTSLTVNKWYHIVFTWDNSNVKLFLNGTQVNSETQTVASQNDTSSLWIGAGFGGIRNWDGRIDEVKIYNYARTDGQIMYDYNRGGPYLRFALDDCSGLTAHDSSGNDQDELITIGSSGSNTTAGTCASGNTAHAWYNGATGKFNSGLDFDGTDDYASTVINNTLLPRTNSDVSMSLWVRRDGTTTSTHGLVCKANGTACSYGMDIQNSDNQWRVNLRNSGSNSSIDSGQIISTGTWYHLVATVDDNGTNTTVRFYLNGNLVKTSAGNIRIGDTGTTGVALGSKNTTTNFLNGALDDVELFSYVLSASQVKKLYNDSAVARFGPTTGQP